MGYLIKICRDGKPLDSMLSRASLCTLGLDARGLFRLGSRTERQLQPLFELRGCGANKFSVRVSASELQESKVKLEPEQTVDFIDDAEFIWRDCRIKVVLIQQCSLLLSALNNSDLLGREPDFILISKELGIEAPVFSGVPLTIGCHKNDAVQVLHPKVKAAHAKIELSGDRSQLDILPHLGSLSTRVEEGKSKFVLEPSGIEFELVRTNRGGSLLGK